jgi:hypothetical protein
VRAIAKVWPDRRSREPQPAGPPIQQLAVDLRRLLRLHADLAASSHLAIRAQATVGDRAGHRRTGGGGGPGAGRTAPRTATAEALSHDELSALLYALGDAGMVLPAKVGPFTGDGRL